MRAAAGFLAAAALAVLVAAAPQQGGAGAALARAADADGDRAVSAEEWGAFKASLAADADGAFDRRRLKARFVPLDEDGDGTLTAADVERALADERGRGLLAQLVRTIADRDGDGALSPPEARAFLDEAQAGGGPIGEAQVAGWLGRAEAIPPADPNAVTPGVWLLGLDVELDLDADGRTTLADLDRLHARLDLDADGRLGRDELAPRASAAGAGEERWAVAPEQRARPPLIPWQRTLEDALALSRASGKPLLLCVNIDGESASESLAFGRYRDPAFAELARGFVPLCASPDRHAPRERDDRGRRLADARFGRLVCSEHVDVEPELFARYFGDRRVAPRHVGVSPAGEVLFDVYLVQDLSLVDAQLAEHGVRTPPAPDPATLGTEDLLASPDAALRDELEARFAAAPEDERVRLASLALSAVRPVQHAELVRLALRDASPAVRLQGVWTLVQHAERAPLAELPLAFARAHAEPELFRALSGAVRRAADAAADPARKAEAELCWRVFSELAAPAPHVDVARWRVALEGAPRAAEPAPDPAERDQVIARLEELERAAVARRDDAGLAVELAAARLRLARVELAAGGNPSYFLEDAVQAARRAAELAPADGRALGYQAWATWLLGDVEQAGELAARALPGLERDAGSELAAEVLAVLAGARTRAVYAALAAGGGWPAGTLADALAAYELLLAHPSGGAAHRQPYLELCAALRAWGREAELVRRALAEDALATDLHAALRQQVLRDEGARALEAAYAEEPLAAARARWPAEIDWFHGLATLVAAEQDVQNRDRDAALGAYARSAERFERAALAAPQYAPSAAHYRCLALAGAARLWVEAGRLDEATEAIAAAVSAAPESARAADGLGRTPAESAREVERALVERGEAERARELRARLAEAGLAPASFGPERASDG